MKFLDMQRLLGEQAVFRSSALLAGQQSAAAVRRQLARWTDSGRIVPLRRGVYVLAESHARVQPHPFVLANELRRASYVSMHSALAHHGMIPEFVPVTTSVTTGRPETLDTSRGRFVFRHIKGELFWGMERTEIAPEQFAVVASPEKALIDLLYLTPGSDRWEVLETLRVDPGEGLIRGRLAEMAEQTGSGKVIRAIARLNVLWTDSGQGAQL